MRAVIQRVAGASVVIDGRPVATIGTGLVMLIAVLPADGASDVSALVDKVAVLRIFPDTEGRMNRSIVDVGGSLLVVSQFTLAADVSRGRRPSFTRAADPEHASPLIDGIVEGFRALDLHTESGVFGAEMDVSLVNHGPVTFVLDVVDGAVR